MSNKPYSDLKLNENLYLVDTCVWIDIAVQLSNLEKYKSHRKASGIQNPSVELIINRIFKSSDKIYVTKRIKEEYLSVFKKNKGIVRIVPIRIRDSVYSYMNSLEEDTYFISSDSPLLTRDLKDGERDRYSSDRRIFISGRSRYIGNIVTQDWDDYKAVRDDLYDKYNPIIYRCTVDDVGIFNGLELKGGKKAPKNEIYQRKSLARRLLEYLYGLLNN